MQNYSHMLIMMEGERFLPGVKICRNNSCTLKKMDKCGLERIFWREQVTFDDTRDMLLDGRQKRN